MDVDDDGTRAEAGPTRSDPAEVRRVVISSYLGNTIEYYDFILYASAAALIFGPLFFSDLSPAAATIASFATFATGYVARPLGAVVFGHLGDRVGRKSTLLATMIIMGIASGSIGLLPTQGQVGVLAPVLLVTLRILQGFAVGGEWGGAALMSAEHAPPGRRGFFTSFAQAGIPSGGLLSSIAMTVIALMPRDQMLAWGWRIPFLVSFGLLVIGLYVRFRISESPLFAELERAQHKARTPLAQVFRHHRGSVLRGIFIAVPPLMGSTLYGSFAVSYAVTQRGFEQATVLAALSLAWLLNILTTPLFGVLSDRFGRRPIHVAGAVVFFLAVYPFFLALQSGSALLLFVAMAFVFAVASNMMNANLAAVLSEMFSTAGRYTGVSTAYQGATLLAGFTPLVAGSLTAAAGGGVGYVVLAVLAVTALSTVAMLLGRESRGRHLDGAAAAHTADCPTRQETS